MQSDTTVCIKRCVLYAVVWLYYNDIRGRTTRLTDAVQCRSITSTHSYYIAVYCMSLCAVNKSVFVLHSYVQGGQKKSKIHHIAKEIMSSESV